MVYSKGDFREALLLAARYLEAAMPGFSVPSYGRSKSGPERLLDAYLMDARACVELVEVKVPEAISGVRPGSSCERIGCLFGA